MTFVRPTGAAQLVLPAPPTEYAPVTEAQRNLALQQADARNRKIGSTIELGTDLLVLTAPDGSRHKVLVSNAGVLSTSAV